MVRLQLQTIITNYRKSEIVLNLNAKKKIQIRLKYQTHISLIFLVLNGAVSRRVIFFYFFGGGAIKTVSLYERLVPTSRNSYQSVISNNNGIIRI